MHDKEVSAPIFVWPWRDQVPDQHADETQSDIPDEGIDEDAPGDDAVAPGVFWGDADELAENVAQAPGRFDRFFTIYAINAAMQHPVKVVWLAHGY